MFKGERVFPKQKYSITKKGNAIFLKREHLDNHIHSKQKIIFSGPLYDRNELEIIKNVKVAETVANVLALKKKQINVSDEWEVFINGDNGFQTDLSLPYEHRYQKACEFIKQHFDIIPNSSS